MAFCVAIKFSTVRLRFRKGYKTHLLLSKIVSGQERQTAAALYHYSKADTTIQSFHQKVHCYSSMVQGWEIGTAGVSPIVFANV